MAKTLEEITAEIRNQMNRNPRAAAYRVDARSLARLLEAADAESDAKSVGTDGLKVRRVPGAKAAP